MPTGKTRSTPSRGRGGRNTGGRTRTLAAKKKKSGGKKRTGGTNYGTPPRNVLRNKHGQPMRYGNGFGGGWRLQKKTGTTG